MRNLILIIIILLCILSCKKDNQSKNLIVKVDRIKVKNDSLTKIVTQDKTELNYWYDEQYDGEKLKEKGIANPEEFIKNSLRKKPELIPLKAVLGGTMHFRNIQLLSSEWLIAAFDDGHIQGRGIYKYKLNNNGELEFELLNSLGPE